MNTAIWIIGGILAALAGYVVAYFISKQNAKSAANIILEDAKREADVIKEKKILQAKEEEMKILSEADRTATQKIQKAQASESRARQREQQLNQQQGEIARRKRELSTHASRHWSNVARKPSSYAARLRRSLKESPVCLWRRLRRNSWSLSRMRQNQLPQAISTTSWTMLNSRHQERLRKSSSNRFSVWQRRRQWKTPSLYSISTTMR